MEAWHHFQAYSDSAQHQAVVKDHIKPLLVAGGILAMDYNVSGSPCKHPPPLRHHTWLGAVRVNSISNLQLRVMMCARPPPHPALLLQYHLAPLGKNIKWT